MTWTGKRMKIIGEHNSFVWNRPGHMEPRGKMRVAAIQHELESQLRNAGYYYCKMPIGRRRFV